MSDHPYLGAILRFWALVVATMILGALAAFGLSQLSTPLYSSSSRLYFSINIGNSGNDLNQGSTYTQAQTLSFAQLTESAVVLEPVIERLGLDRTTKELASSITVDTPENTVILDIIVTDEDPELAADIANQVARSLSAAVDELAPRTLEGETTVALNNITPATPSASPSSPNTRTNVVAGLLLGLVLAVVLIVLRQFSDTRIRSEGMLEAASDHPLLGSIGFDESADDGVLLRRDVAAPAAESYRRLRTNLAQATHESKKHLAESLSIAVASSVEGEGKSTTAVNLALVLAEGNHSVVLVDGNLREPSIAEFTGLRGERGLTDVLEGSDELEDVVQRWESTGVDVVTSGPVPVNPSELLTAATMQRLLERLGKDYEFVVVYTPDVTETADAAIIGRLVDGVLVIAAKSEVRVPQLLATLDSLEKSGARVFGTALNEARTGPLRRAARRRARRR